MSVAFCSLPSARAGGARWRAGAGPRAPAAAWRSGSVPGRFGNPRAVQHTTAEAPATGGLAESRKGRGELGLVVGLMLVLAE